MNRHDRRAKAARERVTSRALVERAEREGYVLFAPTAEHSQKLADIQERLLESLDDISCLDGWSVMLQLASLLAVFGAHNPVDRFEPMPREMFLKNCAEKYDALMKVRERSAGRELQ